MAFTPLEPIPPKTLPRGRPPGPMREYSLELVREIAEQVGDGKLKLIDVCNSDTRFPSQTVFFEWLHDHPEAARVWTAALMARNNLRNEECIEIADKSENDYIAQTNAEAETGATSITMVPRAELIKRVELRLKERHRIAAVELPHKYGAHQALPPPADPLQQAPPVTPAAEGVVNLQEFKDGRGDPYWAAARSYQREEDKAR